MKFLDKLLNNKDICTDKNSPYYNYPKDLKEYCECMDKYHQVWNLAGNYTEKINKYYSDFINTNKNECFNKLFEYCMKYIELLPQLEKANKEEARINNFEYSKHPYCIAYHKLAMAYEKAGFYDSAIGICKEAIASGYSDGTKGDFEARLKRLYKKQNK